MRWPNRPDPDTLGIVAVGVIILVTEGFNAIYGYSLGRYKFEAWGLAAAAAALGLAKVYWPFVIVRAWRSRAVVRCGLGLLVLGGCLAVGHFSTIGVISERKLDRAAGREAATESKELTAKRIKDLEAELAPLAKGRSAATIEAEIKKTARDYSLTWRDRKTKADSLNVELANAKDREEKQAKLDELRDKIDGKATLVGDAQAAMLTRLYGGTQTWWQYVSVLAIAVLLDIISTFGMFLMKTPSPSAPSAVVRKEPEKEQEPANDNMGPGAKILQHPQMKQITDFYDDCVVEEPGSNVGGAELYSAYRAWCKENGEVPMSNRIAGQYFALMIERDSSGRTRREYLNVRLSAGRRQGKMRPDPPAEAIRSKRLNDGLLRLGGV